MRRIPTGAIIATIVCVVILIAVSVIFFAVNNAGQTPDPAYKPEVHGEITYNGTVYKPAPYRINVLFMGIDASGKAVSSSSYMNTGLADFLCLLSFDVRTKECVAIHINRDSITDVAMYGIGGAYLGKAPMQIALSHQYGDGLEFSCLNTSKAVSDLLKNITIDYYVSLHMDGVSALNDLVGGVEVLIEDDFSDVDPAMETGKTITLKGKQAEIFVRARKDVGDQTNLSRMTRQRTYMRALYNKMIGSQLDLTDMYNAIGDYVVTNCKPETMEQFSKQAKNYTLKGIVSLPGEAVAVNGIMEYHIDEDGLTKLIIENLYAPK